MAKVMAPKAAEELRERERETSLLLPPLSGMTSLCAAAVFVNQKARAVCIGPFCTDTESERREGERERELMRER